MSQHNTERTQCIALCSWSVQPLNPQELLEAIDQVGVSGVSLALSPLADQPEIWADAPQRLRDASIELVSGMMATRGEDYATLDSIARTGGLRPDATWPDNLNHARQIAAIAADAKIPLVTFHAGFFPDQANAPERATILERIARIVDLFADHGVNVALETGQERAETLLDVLDELDRPTLGVNFDPANMILYGMGDPVEALRELGPHVMQVHIKDAIASDAPGQWGLEVPVGEGQVDWVGFFQVLPALPRTVDLVIEREAGHHRIKDMKRAKTLLSELAMPAT